MKEGAIKEDNLTEINNKENDKSQGEARNNDTPTTPINVPILRLTKKLEQTHVSNADQYPVNWYKERAFTPNSLFMLNEGNQSWLFAHNNDQQTEVVLHRRAAESHALVKSNNRTIGGSATSSIRTQTIRKKEQYSTHIQYEIKQTQEQGKDFVIKKKNLCHLLNGHRKKMLYQK